MITYSDFTGYYAIAQNPDTQSKLTEYITLYMRQYLVELLGYELYQLFIDDLDPDTPESERFQTIFNVLGYENAEQPWIPYGAHKSRCFDDNRDESLEPTFSEGIKEMLKGFIFFEFVNEYGISVSQTGVVINNDENSTPALGGKHVSLIESRYNRAIKSFKVIRRYILDHLSEYPEYKGIEKDSTYWGGAF